MKRNETAAVVLVSTIHVESETPDGFVGNILDLNIEANGVKLSVAHTDQVTLSDSLAQTVAALQAVDGVIYADVTEDAENFVLTVRSITEKAPITIVPTSDVTGIVLADWTSESVVTTDASYNEHLPVRLDRAAIMMANSMAAMISSTSGA